MTLNHFGNYSRQFAVGFLFLDPANFPADFPADLPREQAEFMAHSQMPTAAKVFNTPITNPA
jgi:hypothetical protein